MRPDKRYTKKRKNVKNVKNAKKGSTPQKDELWSNRPNQEKAEKPLRPDKKKNVKTKKNGSTRQTMGYGANAQTRGKRGNQ